MKYVLLVAWLLVPVAVLAAHFGPGLYYLQADRAGHYLREADEAAKQKNWLERAASYAKAREQLLPTAVNERYRLVLAEAQARIRGGQMVAGQEQLQNLLVEMQDEPNASIDLATSVRNELALSSYYAAWLMRVEGAAADEWLPETDRARRQYRWLAESSVKRASSDEGLHGPAAHRQARIFAKNLEATIKLEQMDLAELLAKPLPKNCPNCCESLRKRKREQCRNRNRSCEEGKKKKKEQQQPKDARKQIKKSNRAGLYSGEGKGS